MVAKALLAASMAAVAVQAKVIEHWWNITYAQANPDGVSRSRSVEGRHAPFMALFSPKQGQR